jgi:hypothetical protein
MKKVFPVAAIFLLIAVALYFFLNSKKAATPSEEFSKQSSSASATENPSAPGKNSASGSSVLPASANPISPSAPQTNLAASAGAVTPLPATATEIPPAVVLENVCRAIREYGAMFGGNPVGTNPEITAALNGNNPKQINFIKPEAGMRVNEAGELVDAWGTPFFFHQLSGTDMEIHSAGPDKIMWTSDDLVNRQE